MFRDLEEPYILFLYFKNFMFLSLTLCEENENQCYHEDVLKITTVIFFTFFELLVLVDNSNVFIVGFYFTLHRIALKRLTGNYDFIHMVYLLLIQIFSSPITSSSTTNFSASTNET